MMNSNSKDGQKSVTDEEMREIQNLLQDAVKEDERSSQHQQWAWTRFQEEMTSGGDVGDAGLWQASYWKSVLTTAGAFMLVVGFYFFFSNEGGSSSGLSVSQTNPDVYATPFYSSEAKADVVWATGYQYLPASYSVRQ